ncbi:alpha/beta hydrolase [Nocardioides mangrovicus]|uniref:Alpha/beta hydrolase n=1 Tax=Nocardioides mangrovicus TaxID=2478913 RepID=A0A3L8NZA2_9ACTN|nr:alpha/beta hydrolase [Nocardioides mangrovicus]RLV48111.1 alpha/beta hydrolase [Nocardioides mangrovicus]
MRSSRRSLLAAGLVGWGAAACGTSDPAPSRAAGARRVRYASGAHRFGELHLPQGTARGTVVTIHGGYWSSQYTLSLMTPIARTLQRAGWAVWNLEYRGLGDGGGWPHTFEDVAAGVDHVRALDVPHDDVRVLGHSAGGHLAVWAAARTDATPGGAPRVRPARVVSLAGVLDLTHGYAEQLGGGAVEQLMGGSPTAVPRRYRLGDPALLVPAGCPVACVRGRDDTTVPRDQSTRYVALDRAAGGTASFTEVGGDHFTIIDPTASLWRTTRRLLEAR